MGSSSLLYNQRCTTAHSFPKLIVSLKYYAKKSPSKVFPISSSDIICSPLSSSINDYQQNHKLKQECSVMTMAEILALMMRQTSKVWINCKKV